jgi:hypothetical protein
VRDNDHCPRHYSHFAGVRVYFLRSSRRDYHLPVMDPHLSNSQEGEEGLGDAGSPSLATFDSSLSGLSGGSSRDGPPQRTASSNNINKSAHRQSFAENLRNAPSSPRHRHPSFTQAAVQELLNHPPSGHRHTNSRFAGREWGEITVGELVSSDDVKWVDMDSSVEEATMVSRCQPNAEVVLS